MSALPRSSTSLHPCAHSHQAVWRRRTDRYPQSRSFCLILASSAVHAHGQTLAGSGLSHLALSHTSLQKKKQKKKKLQLPHRKKNGSPIQLQESFPSPLDLSSSITLVKSFTQKQLAIHEESSNLSSNCLSKHGSLQELCKSNTPSFPPIPRKSEHWHLGVTKFWIACKPTEYLLSINWILTRTFTWPVLF